MQRLKHAGSRNLPNSVRGTQPVESRNSVQIEWHQIMVKTGEHMRETAMWEVESRMLD